MRRLTPSKKHMEDSKWLSEWQDLSLYAEAKSFSFYHWGMQLWKRAQLLKSIDMQFRDNYHRELKKAPLALGQHEFSFPYRQAIQDISHRDIQQLVRLHALPGIRDLTDDWDTKYGSIPTASRFLNAGFVAGNQSSPGWHVIHGIQLHPLLIQVAAEEQGEQTDSEFERHLAAPFVGVDLRFSDKALRAGFEKWLQNRRRQLTDAGITSLGIPPKRAAKRNEATVKLTSGTLADWYSIRALPYIDIRLMAKFNERKAPSAAVIGEHLYPGQVGAAEKVQQRLIPLSKKLLQQSTYQRLINEGVATMLRTSTTRNTNL